MTKEEYNEEACRLRELFEHTRLKMRKLDDKYIQENCRFEVDEMVELVHPVHYPQPKKVFISDIHVLPGGVFHYKFVGVNREGLPAKRAVVPFPAYGVQKIANAEH